MDKKMLEEVGINVTDGVERFNNNITLYEKFLKAFPKEKHFKDLEEAIVQEDLEAAFHAAHALKGVAGNLSMTELQKALIPLVEALRVRRGDLVSDQMKIVEMSYQKSITAILTAFME